MANESQPDIYARVLATLAILISSASFLVSYFAFRRDSEKLVANSVYCGEGNRADFFEQISIQLFNKGRRSVWLQYIEAEYDGGLSKKEAIGFHGEGVELKEKKSHTIEQIEIISLIYDKEKCLSAKNLWILDSLGNRYAVKNAKRHMKLFLKNPIGNLEGKENNYGD